MENKDLERAVYMWFNMKYELYNKLETDGSIYLYYDGDEYAEIRIDKKSKDIYYRYTLYKEFSEIIPLDYYDFQDIMIKWVEDTFGLKGFTTQSGWSDRRFALKIPLV